MGQMSHDRIRFFLASRYFQACSRNGNGMHRDICLKILQDTMGMDICETTSLMVDHPNGFWIVCRPSQFARFIVQRHELGDCINGIRDLNPSNFTPQDPAEQIAEQIAGQLCGINWRDVLQVLDKLRSYTLHDVDLACPDKVIDVSMNSHKGC